MLVENKYHLCLDTARALRSLHLHAGQRVVSGEVLAGTVRDPRRCGGGGGRGDEQHLTLHCYRWDDFCIKMISDESHFNVSLTVRDKIQTHERFKRTFIYYDIDTQSAHFRGNPLRQATKRHLNNSSTVKNDEK